MRVGILGSGLMGGKLGTIFARSGHEVVFARSEQNPHATGASVTFERGARTASNPGPSRRFSLKVRPSLLRANN